MFNLSKYRIVNYKGSFYIQRRMNWSPWVWEFYRWHNTYDVGWDDNDSYAKRFTTIERARETLMELCAPRVPKLVVIEEYNE